MVEDNRYDDSAYDDDAYTGETDNEEDGGGWLGGISVGLLLLVGVILFFFPEPVTTEIGILLIGLAIVVWIAKELL